MFRNIVSAIREAFTATIIGDTRAFCALKGKHRFYEFLPGTMGQARALLEDAFEAVHFEPRQNYNRRLPKRLIELLQALEEHDQQHNLVTGWCRCGKRWMADTEEPQVGRWFDISRSNDIRHSVGMEYAKAEDGWIFERLDFLDSSLEALRHNGRLMAFCDPHPFPRYALQHPEMAQR